MGSEWGLINTTLCLASRQFTESETCGSAGFNARWCPDPNRRTRHSLFILAHIVGPIYLVATALELKIQTQETAGITQSLLGHAVRFTLDLS